MIELVFHARRPYPPVPQQEPAAADSAGNGAGSAGGAISAEEARAELAATEGR
jgi:hypothetical protein